MARWNIKWKPDPKPSLIKKQESNSLSRMPGLSQDASFATALSGGALLALWLGLGLATGRLQLPSFFAPAENNNDKKIKVDFRLELKIIAIKGCS